MVHRWMIKSVVMWLHILVVSLLMCVCCTQQPLSSVLDSIKSILSTFNLQKLFTQLRSLALQLQATSDPLTKLVTVIDTVVDCLFPSP